MLGLFTFLRFAKNKPIAVLASAVMSLFPLRVDDWPFPYLDDAITRQKAGCACGSDEFDVCPLITVMMDVIGDLAQENAFRLQYPIRFA